MAEDPRQSQSSTNPSDAKSGVNGASSTSAEPGVDEALSKAESAVNELSELAGESSEGEGASAAGADAAGAGDGAAPGGGLAGIEMLGDVELQVTVELGRTRLLVEDVLRFF